MVNGTTTKHFSTGSGRRRRRKTFNIQTSIKFLFSSSCSTCARLPEPIHMLISLFVSFLYFIHSFDTIHTHTVLYVELKQNPRQIYGVEKILFLLWWIVFLATNRLLVGKKDERWWISLCLSFLLHAIGKRIIMQAHLVGFLFYFCEVLINAKREQRTCSVPKCG